MVRNFVIFLIEIYQHTLSPDHGLGRIFFPNGVCRYHPTCSEYTKEALKRFGLVKGISFGLKRVSRCHPWATGGIDHVPNKIS